MSGDTYTQEYIQDLTDRVFLVQQKLNEGKIHVPSHLVEAFKDSLLKIRLNNDGLVIPESVDGVIKTTALAIEITQEREDIKSKYSISYIQEAYFNHLFSYFGDLYRFMVKADGNSWAAAEFFSKDTNLMGQLSGMLPDIFAFFKEFWKNCSDVGTYHLQDGNQLKSPFSGDIFPNFTENPISIAGLYIDTITLPCPVLKVAKLYGVHPEPAVIKLLLKHVLTAMSYKDFAIADVEPHLILIQPPSADIIFEQRTILVNESKPIILKHASYLFARKFESIEEFKDFCGRIETVDDAMKHLKRPDRLVIDSQWGSDPRIQLETAISQSDKTIFGQKSTAGNQILATCFGRISQAYGIRENAIEYRGTPYIQAEASWKYYSWLMEYSSEGYDSDAQMKGLHVVRALSSEIDNDLAWLGKVPPEVVLKLRANGQAEEIRALLSTGISDLIKNDPANYYATAEKVVGNLDVAFQKHKKQLIDARNKKLRLYGIDIPACLTVGTIAVAAAYTQSVMLGEIAAGVGMFGGPTLMSIRSKYKDLQTSENLFKSSPTALLFNHIK